MTASTSLLDVILNLLRDPHALAAYQSDPTGYLSSCGNFTPQDVHDALVLAEDSKDSDPKSHDSGDHHVPDAPHASHGESEHEAAVKYLHTYVTNNYIDHRETIVDNSVHQNVDTHGGDFDQNIDIHSTTASGDGAVAAGGSIDGSTVVTGSGNQVGNGNVHGDGNVVGDGNQAVTGDHNTSSFGSGAATSTDVHGDVHVGDGGAFASGGSAAVDNSDNSINHSLNDQSNNSVNDSGNDLSNNSVHDSGNTHLDGSVHDSGNDSSQTHISDVGNDESDHHTEVDQSQVDVGNVHA